MSELLRASRTTGPRLFQCGLPKCTVAYKKKLWPCFDTRQSTPRSRGADVGAAGSILVDCKNALQSRSAPLAFVVMRDTSNKDTTAAMRCAVALQRSMSARLSLVFILYTCVECLN